MHDPSTSKFVVMSSTTRLSLLAYSPLVSNQGLLGTVAAKRRRIHETAVSCNRISCMCPGCTLALSPIRFLKPWSRSACPYFLVTPPVALL